LDKAYCFNRKENKNHGEGGSIVGSKLAGDVLIIDDVITAGTAIKEAANIIRENKANLSGVVVALDRQEKGNGSLSAIQELEKAYEISIINIINLQDIISFLEKSNNPNLQTNAKAVDAYRDRYGVS
jgi:orotate phosphoribosyltransferase